jgi:hypothetical protein
MADILDDDFEPNPPTAERVAARALVLSVVSCRGLIEKDAGKRGAEEFRQRLLPWLEHVGAAEELESDEAALISTPLGELDRKKGLDASWRSEGMTVLAWVLGCTELPPVHIQSEPSEVANSMGFLEEREDTPLYRPHMRAETEIDQRRDTYLTLHWRLRQYSIDAASMDFCTYVAACEWATLRLDELEILDRDLAIGGVRIDRVKSSKYREVLSITQERHHAFNWLLGFEEIYAEVTTDK